MTVTASLKLDITNCETLILEGNQIDAGYKQVAAQHFRKDFLKPGQLRNDWQVFCLNQCDLSLASRSLSSSIAFKTVTRDGDSGFRDCHGLITFRSQADPFQTPVTRMRGSKFRKTELITHMRRISY